MKSCGLIGKASWLAVMLFNSQLVMACFKTIYVEAPSISTTTTCPPTTGCSVNAIPDQQGRSSLTVTLATNQTGSCPSLAVTCTQTGVSGVNIVLYSFFGPAGQFTCPNPAGCLVCSGAAGCPVQCVNGQLMFTDGTGRSQPLVSLNC